MNGIFQIIFTDLRTILLMDTFRWFLVGAFIVRLFTVMLFNHLTWRKLFSLTFILAITGSLSVLGIAWLDESLPGIEFHGYPESFMIAILTVYGLGQIFAKVLLVANEAGFHTRKAAQQERAARLLRRAQRFTRRSASHSFLKG